MPAGSAASNKSFEQQIQHALTCRFEGNGVFFLSPQKLLQQLDGFQVTAVTYYECRSCDVALLYDNVACAFSMLGHSSPDTLMGHLLRLYSSRL